MRQAASPIRLIVLVYSHKRSQDYERFSHLALFSDECFFVRSFVRVFASVVIATDLQLQAMRGL